MIYPSIWLLQYLLPKETSSKYGQTFAASSSGACKAIYMNLHFMSTAIATEVPKGHSAGLDPEPVRSSAAGSTATSVHVDISEVPPPEPEEPASDIVAEAPHAPEDSQVGGCENCCVCSVWWSVWLHSSKIIPRWMCRLTHL